MGAVTEAEHGRLVTAPRASASRLGVQDHLELVSPGWEGLEAARRAYDPEYPGGGASFWSFSNYWVWGAMLAYARGSRSKYRQHPVQLEDRDRPREESPRLDALDSAKHALRNLTRKQREAFVAREGLGMSCSEVGARLGISHQGASQVLARARAGLGLPPDRPGRRVMSRRAR